MYDLIPQFRRNYQWSTTAAGLIAHTARDFLTADPHSVTQTAEEDTNSMYGVTTQRDAVLQYRRRAMPYRKKRKWISFVKKVHAVAQKEEGTKAIIRNNTITCSWDNSTQFACCATLYGLRGTDDAFNIGNADISTILGADVTTDSQWENVRFTSAVLDITLTNTGTNRLEIDIYEIGFVGKQSGPSLGTDLAAALTSITQPGIGYATVSAATRGFTPFEASAFCSKGYRIYKKTKYFIPPNEILTYQIRDPKNHHIPGADVWSTGTNTQSQLRYVTKNLFIIGKSVPGSTFGGAGDQNIYNVGITRTYKYKEIGDNRDELGTI